MEPNENPAETQDLFDDKAYRLVQASMGKRFLNYLIDAVVYGVLIFIALLVMMNLNPRATEAFVKKYETGEFSLVEQLLMQVV